MPSIPVSKLCIGGQPVLVGRLPEGWHLGQYSVWHNYRDTSSDALTWNDTWDGNWHPKNIKRIRLECPRCGRRLMSSVRICHDACCVHHYLPHHKPKGWWKKKRVIRKGHKMGRKGRI